MALTREEIAKLTVAELQSELKAKGLDTSGKKVELIDRLLAVQAVGGAVGEDRVESKVLATAEHTGEGRDSECGISASAPANVQSAQALMAKLKLIQERHAVEAARLKVRTRAEEEDLQLRMRSEQIEVEIQLAELDSVDMAALQPLRVAVGSERSGTTAPEAAVLSAQVRRVLLPPAELRPFSGAVEEFRLFLRAFQSRIASRTDDQGELLYYLEQYTRGKPNQLVRGCLHLGDEGYSEAWKLLESRYGNSLRLMDSYVEKVEQWSRLQSGDVEGLDRFALFLTEVQNAMCGVSTGEFEHHSTLRLIASKLPSYLQDRWLREADRLSEGGKKVSFSDMVHFISAEVRVKRSPIFGPRPAAPGRASETGARHKVSTARVVDPVVPSCVFCGADHRIEECRELLRRTWVERRRVLMRNQLCFGCLRRGHRVQACRRPLHCGACGGPHHLCLHRELEMVSTSAERQPSVRPSGAGSGSLGAGPGTGRTAGSAGGTSREKAGGVISASLGVRGVSRTALPVIPVRLRGPTGMEVVVNGFMDTGSSGSFVTESLARRLDVSRDETSISIETLGNRTKVMPTSLASGLEVCSLSGAEYIPLPPLITIDRIPVTQSDRCQMSKLRAAAHLQDVEFHEVEAPVELLLGSNCAPFMLPREVRSPPPGEGGLCGVFYLEQFTSGVPRDIVRSCMNMATEGYKTARSLLEKRYGEPEKIADSFVNNLLNRPIVKADDVTGLDNFALELRTCQNAVGSLQQGLHELDPQRP